MNSFLDASLKTATGSQSSDHVHAILELSSLLAGGRLFTDAVEVNDVGVDQKKKGNASRRKQMEYDTATTIKLIHK